MATIRALMKGDYQLTPVDADTFRWSINFACWPLNGSGELFDLQVAVDIETGDTAAATQTKIINAVVAGVTQRQPTDVMPRTNVYLLDFIRGS